MHYYCQHYSTNSSCIHHSISTQSNILFPCVVFSLNNTIILISLILHFHQQVPHPIITYLHSLHYYTVHYTTTLLGHYSNTIIDHCPSIMIILYYNKLKSDTKHTLGISLKSQELYAIVFTARYVDIFWNFSSKYNTIMKLIFLGSTYWLIYIIR